MPLAGYQVWEIADGPGAAFVGRLLAFLGADVERLEPKGGSPLRLMPPFTERGSAAFEYLCAGKRAREIPDSFAPQELEGVHIIVHDSSTLPRGLESALEDAPLPARGRVIAACTPYGLDGPKSSWAGSELTLFQGGGEGYLMPHGLPFEEHPDRPPVGMARYVGHYEGGLATAVAAVAALRHSRQRGQTTRVDVSIQDAEVSLNYFTVSRFVEGTRESRATRAFKYGGILQCSDGYVELAPLEQHQWLSLREMLGDPEWARASALDDPLQRGEYGDLINQHLRAWAAERSRAEVVALAAEHNIPAGEYLRPEELPDNEQLRHRSFFVAAQGEDGSSRPFPGPPWMIDDRDKPEVGLVPSLATE